MNSTPPEPPRSRHRRLLWAAFWFMFFGTPALAFLVPTAGGRLGVRSLEALLFAVAGAAGGALGAGFLLAKLVTDSTLRLVQLGVRFGLMIFVVYLMIAFAGCLYMVDKGHE